MRNECKRYKNKTTNVIKGNNFQTQNPQRINKGMQTKIF